MYFLCSAFYQRKRKKQKSWKYFKEAQDLFDRGYREVTLLGQNVDSYLWYGTEGLKKYYENLSEEEKAQSINFAQLMEKVAQISPEVASEVFYFTP